MIEPFAPLVAQRKLQTFLPPEPLDLLVIDLPAFNMEQLSDLAVAKPAVLLRQPDQSPPQRIVISVSGWSRTTFCLVLGMCV